MKKQNKDNTISLNEIAKNLSLIATNKFNPEQSRLLFMAISFEIIMRKDLFPKNTDLKKFCLKYYVPLSKSKAEFRDYIFYSRTLLGSKIEKILLKEASYVDLIEKAAEMSSIFSINTTNSKHTSYNSTSEQLMEWINAIRSNIKK